MGKIKENWQIIVFTAFVTMAFSLILTLIMNREAKVSGSASVEYVDRTKSDMKTYVDFQDNELKTRVIKNENHLSVVEDKLDLKADRSDFQRMDEKLDKIYEILIHGK